MEGMEIYLTEKNAMKNRYYECINLLLPTTQDAIADALYRLHLEDGAEYTVNCDSGWPEFLEQIISETNGISVEEVNLLAYQMSQMDQFQKETFEGAVQLRQEENIDVPVTMKELINLAHNLDCYEYYPGIVDDFVLGHVVLENALLDMEKVGQQMRCSEMGTFTESGYICLNHTPHQEFYDRIQLPDIPNIPDMPKGIISVQVCSVDRPKEDDIWLDLPATEQEMQKVLTQLNESSFDNCLIKKSISTAFPYPLACDEDIEKLNTLAQKIQEFPDQNTLAKFKAALELELRNDLDFALDITENLDCYNYNPQLYFPVIYAEHLLKEAGIDISDLAFLMFDFIGYRKRQI